MSDPGTKAEVVKATGEAAVEVGKVFGTGGTDGLILYALILATFLMFLALVFVLVFSSRTIKASQENERALAQVFREASGETAEALRELATSVATTAASDATRQIHEEAAASRIESALRRIEPLLKRLEG